MSTKQTTSQLADGLSGYVLNTISIAVLLVDVDYVINFANQALLTKIGVSQKQALGTKLFDLPGITMADNLKRMMDEMRVSRRPVRLEGVAPLTSVGDDVVPIDLLIHPWLDDESRFVGWLIICEDAGANKSFFSDVLRVNIFVRYVVNLMSEGATVLNREGKLEYANKRFYEMLGYQPEDIINRTWTDWCYEGDLEEGGRGKKIKNEQLMNGVSVFRLRLKKKDGTLLPVTMSVLKNVEEDLNIGSIGVIVDETEKLKLESEYQAVSDLNDKILETISTYIVTLDMDMKVKFVNKQIEEEFGVSSAEIVGKSIKDIAPSLRVLEDWSSWVMRSLRPYKVDRYKLNTQDEGFLFINVDIQPLYVSKQLQGVVCSFDDVTLSARLEEQIEASYRELEITHGKLANFLKRQSDFLADVSHELRTPLTIMKGNIEVALQDDRVTEGELKEVLAMVENEVSRMSVMVEDLMMLTKMDQGESALRNETYNTNDLAEDLLSKMEMYGEYQNRLRVKQIEDYAIRGDRDKLLTMIWNLVENGMKYSPSDSRVELSILKGEPGSNELVIEVLDFGIGISEEDAKNVFDRFFRVDKARSRDRGGSGLGLAICKRIAEAHQGRIEVVSSPDTGTTFSVYLPIIISNN